MTPRCSFLLENLYGTSLTRFFVLPTGLFLCVCKLFLFLFRARRIKDVGCLTSIVVEQPLSGKGGRGRRSKASSATADRTKRSGGRGVAGRVAGHRDFRRTSIERSHARHCIVSVLAEMHGGGTARGWKRVDAGGRQRTLVAVALGWGQMREIFVKDRLQFVPNGGNFLLVLSSGADVAMPLQFLDQPRFLLLDLPNVLQGAQNRGDGHVDTLARN